MRELACTFPKPSFYAGIENGIVIKDKDKISLHIALAFPDTYELGMSYLGQKILYDIANANPDWWAERVMCPDFAAAQILHERKSLLATLESDTNLKDLDAIGFSVTHELCFTDILHMLDLADIPLRTEDRGEDLSEVPLIMAGGGAMLGAEALAPFIDLAALGDGEELFPEILSLLEKAIKEKWTRSFFLSQASDIPGVYIPSLFKEDAQGRLQSSKPAYRPKRRIVVNLDDVPYPVRQVTPVSAIHNRLSLEIARGCTRGCRFCHAGIVYRPPRERNPANLGKILDKCLDYTGFDEVSFLSLSAGDYSALDTLYKQSYERCAAEQITLSLPSLRVGSVGSHILAKMASLRRTGMTLAPEAGTQRLRDVINKGISEEELLEHVRLLGNLGWQHIKLYFMIGLPTETDDDLRGIFELCEKAQSAGSAKGRKMRITASLSTFTPKAFTPFQWEEQISLEEMKRRIFFLRDLFKSRKSLQLRWHEPKISYLEGILSRSDRRLSDVVEKAYRKGAIFCGWNEYFKLEPWLEALEECGLKAEDYTGAREPDKALPWDHLECGISNDFLLKERGRAYQGLLTQDCRYGKCGNCGACDRGDKASLLAKSSPEQKSQSRLVFPKRDQESLENENSLETLPNHESTKEQQSELRVQYRLWHRKLGNFSLLSQLELQTIVEKSLRRAKLPLAFSQGFHPLPKISFGRALPVGVQSHAEWLAFTLTEDLPLKLVLDRLNQCLRPELQAFHIEYTDKKSRTAQAEREIFKLSISEEQFFYRAIEAFQSFAEKEKVEYSRAVKEKVKNYDLRPMLESWRILKDELFTLQFTVNWADGYLSPLLFANAILGYNGQKNFTAMSICKIAQLFPDGRLYGQEGFCGEA